MAKKAEDKTVAPKVTAKKPQQNLPPKQQQNQLPKKPHLQRKLQRQKLLQKKPQRQKRKLPSRYHPKNEWNRSGFQHITGGRTKAVRISRILMTGLKPKMP